MKRRKSTWKGLDFSPLGRSRVVALTVIGTLVCIAVAFAIDGYSFKNGWEWGAHPINNLIIPLVLAPPFFYFLLSKLRELALAHQELLVISMTDSLTSCYNRHAFTTLVDRYLDRMTGSARDGALLVIDVDHFKNVNDSFGHDVGDEALVLIAGTIKKSVRDTDAVGRLGGEEFGVFLPGAGFTLAATVAERIRVAVNNVEFIPQGEPYRLSVSVGGTTFSYDATFSELYRQADQRLYNVKRNGRNRVEIVAAMSEPEGKLALVH